MLCPLYHMTWGLGRTPYPTMLFILPSNRKYVRQTTDLQVRTASTTALVIADGDVSIIKTALVGSLLLLANTP